MHKTKGASAGMLFSPESPRWQYSKGEAVSAMASATKLWGSQGPASLEDGAKPGDNRQPAGATLKQLLQCKGVVIGVFLFVAQQLSGINAVVYFSSATFMEVHLPDSALSIFSTLLVYVPGMHHHEFGKLVVDLSQRSESVAKRTTSRM